MYIHTQNIYSIILKHPFLCTVGSKSLSAIPRTVCLKILISSYSKTFRAYDRVLILTWL